MKKCPYCGAEYSDDMVACALDQTSLDSSPPSRSVSLPAFSSWSGWSGLIVGILGTGFVAFLSYPFFSIHHNIGPGGAMWLGIVLFIAGVTFLLGLPCAIVGIVKGRRLIGWLGVVFTLAPLPTGIVMLKVAMMINGVHAE